MWQADVDEALRLMQMSKISLHDDEGRRRAVEDPISAIYGRIREDILRNEKDTYSWEEVVALCGSYTVSTTVFYLCAKPWMCTYKKSSICGIDRSLIISNTDHLDFSNAYKNRSFAA